mgnify:CR=1 FL=1
MRLQFQPNVAHTTKDIKHSIVLSGIACPIVVILSALGKVP